MRSYIRTMSFPVAIILISLFSSCKKNSSSSGSGGGGTGAVRRPATMKVYDGTIGTLAPVLEFFYDNNNLLTRYGTEKDQMRYISSRKVTFKLFGPNLESTTDYVYGAPIDRSDIYDPANQPRSVSIQTSIYNTQFNQTTQPPVIEWVFGFNSNNQLAIEKTANGKGIQGDYSYDDAKNLKQIQFKELSGTLANQVYMRISVTSYDDKFSPFSAVKGYRWASYPQYYNDAFALANCIHNPLQMKTERWSVSKNAFYLAETTNFNYTYNDDGYPTRIVVSTTYTPETGPSGGSLKNYEFTYN